MDKQESNTKYAQENNQYYNFVLSDTYTLQSTPALYDTPLTP